MIYYPFLSQIAAKRIAFALLGTIIVALAIIFRHGLTLVIGQRMSFVSGKALLSGAIFVLLIMAILLIIARLFRK